MSETTIQPARRTRRYQCRHIFSSGHRCGSPSLRNEEFCFYHHTTRGAVEQAQEGRDRFSAFELPRLEDHGSIMVAIEEVLQRLAACAIDTRRAGLLLYGLQTASIALARTEGPKREPEPVEEVVHHPRLGTVARRAVVVVPGEEQPTLEPEEEEDLTAEEAVIKAAEAHPAKPTGVAAMSQEEIARLYEDHISQISHRTPGETAHPAILRQIQASTSADAGCPIFAAALSPLTWGFSSSAFPLRALLASPFRRAAEESAVRPPNQKRPGDGPEPLW